ncbi:O-methyltransferase [Alloscardovia criceti]|uniref:O-methyltransferase n=1 Tax=Alloscardovia criceti TaxID=356828 RepID=UPI0004760DBE|nr:hypothetical protein [Alloscardovia criceti]
MNSTTYSHIAQAWTFIEETSADFDSATSKRLRNAYLNGSHNEAIASSSQAQFLTLQARLIQAQTVLVLGSESGIEIPALVSGMNNAGQLTVVTSSAESADATRTIFDSLPSTRTKMRSVDAQASQFVQRLNAHDYDLIVVAAEAENYTAAFDHAQRLLRSNGLLILTDAMAMSAPKNQGGVPNPADRSEKAVVLREIITALMQSEDYDATLLSIGTGLLYAIAH